MSHCAKPTNFEQKLGVKGLVIVFLAYFVRSARRTFLMNYKVVPMQKMKVGTCPHGLPAGACPICSGMGGGGGGSSKARRVPSEMSWDECVAAGRMIQAQKLAQQKKDVAMQAQLHASLNLSGKLENMAQKIASFAEKIGEFAQKVQSSSIPKIISQPLALAAKMIIPVLNLLKNIPLIAQKAINFVQAKFADISDKLSAVFGELKNATEKKISDKFKDFRKKLKSFLGVLEPTEVDEIEDEDKRIEEAKRLFDMKKTLLDIEEKYKMKEEAHARS